QMEQGARHVGIRWFDTLAVLEAEWNSRLTWLWKVGIRWGVLGALALCVGLLAPRLAKVLRMRRRVLAARRGQASVGDATLLYERMLGILKRHGYQKPAWFTPAEFAASLPGGSLASAVVEFTTA